MERHPTTPLNVLVTHPEPLLAVGLAAALRQQLDIKVFGHHDLEPGGEHMDVIVTDHSTALRLAGGAHSDPLSRAHTPTRVMVVTSSDREQDVRLALQSGVHGYLLLGCPIDELVAAVRALGRGSRYLCTAVAHRMAESLTRQSLTARESEVLRLVALGQCNKVIARTLDIAIGTVKAHLTAIMGKLDAQSRTQAASIAAQRGLVDGMGHGHAVAVDEPSKLHRVHAQSSLRAAAQQRA
jgi:DNA-binding NarL/FixJ family response regulator